MLTPADLFAERLLHILDQRIDELANQMIGGVVEDFAHFQRLKGQVMGLKTARTEVVELLAPMMNADPFDKDGTLGRYV